MWVDWNCWNNKFFYMKAAISILRFEQQLESSSKIKLAGILVMIFGIAVLCGKAIAATMELYSKQISRSSLEQLQNLEKQRIEKMLQ